MKNILLLTDLSPESSLSVSYTISVFGTDNIQYTLLHTTHIPTTNGPVDVSLVEVQKQSARILEREREMLNQQFKLKRNNLKITSKVGNLVDVVNQMMTQTHFDVIALSTKGEDDFFDKVFGTISMNMVSSIPSNLFIIPSDTRLDSIHKVLFVCDRETLDTTYKLEGLQLLLQNTGAQMQILNLVEKETEILQQDDVKAVLEPLFTNVEHNYKHMYAQHFAEQIQEEIATNHFDVVAIVPKHYNFIQQLFHEKIAENLLKQPQVPILAMNK